MIQKIFSLDLIWMQLMLAPAGILLAAWALRMACSFSSVTPPRFVHAILSVVAIVVAHLAVSYYLDWYQVPSGIGRMVFAPLLTWTVVVGVSVPTGPLSAVSVAVFHAGLCLLLFFGLAAVGDALLLPLLA